MLVLLKRYLFSNFEVKKKNLENVAYPVIGGMFYFQFKLKYFKNFK